MKDFDGWNRFKKVVDADIRTVFCRKREVRWCSVGLNIGAEIDGKHASYERPVLIMEILDNHLVMVIPLTTQNKTNKYGIKITCEKIEFFALTSQMRTISTKRLGRKMFRLPSAEFNIVAEACIQCFHKAIPPSKEGGIAEPGGDSADPDQDQARAQLRKGI